METWETPEEFAATEEPAPVVEEPVAPVEEPAPVVAEDPTSEPSSGDTAQEPTASPSESTSESTPTASSPSELTDESSEPSSEPTPETSPTESETSSDGQTDSSPQAAEAGLLAGTTAEVAPGVGGTGDHPAPAAVLNEDGSLHVAGEPPVGNIAPSQAPAGDSTDLPSGDVVTDPAAREKLNAETEPEPIETDRPDIGTE